MSYSAYILIVTALASARIAVLLAHDTILEAPRDWIFRHWPPYDNSAMGYTYQTRDKNGVPLPMGAKRDGHLWSEVLTCTRCLTVWTSIPLFAAVWYSSTGLLIVELLAVMAAASWAAKKL